MTPPQALAATLPGITSGARRRTLLEIDARAVRAASALKAAGLGEDDSVALLLRNDFAFFEATQAAAKIGAYATPVNWHYTAAEAAYILRDSGAKALVAHTDLYRRVGGVVPPGVNVYLVPTPPEIRDAYALSADSAMNEWALPEWDDAIAGAAPLAAPPLPPRLSTIYTSGTTGHPKGVERRAPTPEQLARLELMRPRWWGLGTGEPTTVLMNGPMYHSAPNNYGLSALRTGADIVLQTRFEAEELLALIETHRISHMHIVPTMFVRLLRLPPEIRARYDLSSLRFVVHGAAPCAPEVKAAMLAWWGPVIYEYYGSTESGVATHITPEEALRKPGSVGRPMPDVRIAIVDENRQPVGPGEVGEIFVGSGNVPDFTYRGRPESRAEIDLGGLVTCGDVGRIDEDGYLFLCDRKRDMVISGGVNIYPAEIEAALIGYTGIKDCAVFGLPDEEFGEVLHACILPVDGSEALDVSGIRTFLEERLARFKIPKYFEIVDDLPREDSGKIFKRKLQAARSEARRSALGAPHRRS
jgi:long-chain acyl-CoA synthetase